MRKYRDQVLRETPEGRAIIRLYYKLSPVVVALLQEDTVLREYLTSIANLWGSPMVKAMDEDEEFRGKITEMLYVIFPLSDDQAE